MATLKEMEDLEEYLTTAVSPQSATQRLRQGYETTRFVRVGTRGGRSSHVPFDLRPAPLETSGVSLQAVLDEGPPAPPFPPNFAAAKKDGEQDDIGKTGSESAKKQEAKSKKPFMKRVFSRKPEAREDSPDAANAEFARKGYSTSLSDDENPLATPQNTDDWDFKCIGESNPFGGGRATPAPLPSPDEIQYSKVRQSSRNVSEGRQTPLSSPQSPFFRNHQARKPTPMTPGQPMNTRYPSTDHSSQENNPFDTSFRNPWVYPSGPISPDFYTPRFSSSSPSPLNVSLSTGKAAQLLGPEAPYTPPFGHERVTKEHLSLKNLPGISKEDLSRLPKMLEPNKPESSLTPYSAPPTTTTFGSSDSPKSFRTFGHPAPPKPKRDRYGKLSRFDVSYPHNDTLQSRSYVNVHGHGAAATRFASNNTINASVTPGNRANSSDMENSVGNAAPSKPGVIVRAKREDSYESAKSTVIYTPPTPRSGARTPKTPREFDDFYSRPGPNATFSTAYRHNDFETSPTTMRFNTSDPAMPRRMPPPPPPILPVETSTGTAALTPEPVFSPAARNILRYFSEHWNEQGMRDLCSWIDDESRLDAVDIVRRCTETEIRAYNGGDEHPNHGREFDSRNLWCAQHQGRCALCDAVCCVYKEAQQAYHEAPTEQCRVLAKQAGALIQRASGFEEEESTFLPCAECQQLVCPGCVGRCPVEECGLFFCKACKAEPWEPCAPHNFF